MFLCLVGCSTWICGSVDRVFSWKRVRLWGSVKKLNRTWRSSKYLTELRSHPWALSEHCWRYSIRSFLSAYLSGLMKVTFMFSSLGWPCGRDASTCQHVSDERYAPTVYCDRSDGAAWHCVSVRPLRQKWMVKCILSYLIWMDWRFSCRLLRLHQNCRIFSSQTLNTSDMFKTFRILRTILNRTYI